MSVKRILLTPKPNEMEKKRSIWREIDRKRDEKVCDQKLKRRKKIFQNQVK